MLTTLVVLATAIDKYVVGYVRLLGTLCSGWSLKKLGTVLYGRLVHYFQQRTRAKTIAETQRSSARLASRSFANRAHNSGAKFISLVLLSLSALKRMSPLLLSLLYLLLLSLSLSPAVLRK